jgi:hypothetical protein
LVEVGPNSLESKHENVLQNILGPDFAEDASVQPDSDHPQQFVLVTKEEVRNRLLSPDAQVFKFAIANRSDGHVAFILQEVADKRPASLHLLPTKRPKHYACDH